MVHIIEDGLILVTNILIHTHEDLHACNFFFQYRYIQEPNKHVSRFSVIHYKGDYILIVFTIRQITSTLCCLIILNIREPVTEQLCQQGRHLPLIAPFQGHHKQYNQHPPAATNKMCTLSKIVKCTACLPLQ
jgi:hypothetical protein